MSKFKKFLPLLMQIVALLTGGFAVQQHVLSNQPGVYSSVSVAGLPLAEILAGLTSIGTFISGGMMSLKGGAAVPQGQSNIGAIAQELAQAGDKEGLDLLSPLCVHLAKKGAVKP